MKEKILLGIFVLWEIYYSYWCLTIHKKINKESFQNLFSPLIIKDE
jgi:hypothetical protein